MNELFVSVFKPTLLDTLIANQRMYTNQSDPTREPADIMSELYDITMVDYKDLFRFCAWKGGISQYTLASRDQSYQKLKKSRL